MIRGIITGPTGVGKTKTVLSIAKQLGCEIINSDSRQIYQGVSIGVAAPSESDFELIPHHLFGFLPLEEQYSVGRYYRDVKSIVEANPSKDYLIVGGTGFYLKAISQGLTVIPEISMEIKNEVKLQLETKGLMTLHDQLKYFDKKSYQRLSPSDTNRITRATEVYRATGKAWSEFEDEKEPPLFSGEICVLSRDRDVLYERINRRLITMLQEGWVKEIDDLLRQGYSFHEPGLNSLGYKEIAERRFANNSIDDIIPTLQQKTRNYAKRQITFIRTQLMGCIHFNMADLNFESQIQTFFNK